MPKFWGRIVNGDCMKGYEPSTYGNRIAALYDDWYQTAVDPTPTANFLAALLARSNARKAVELGVGTGRVAIALQSLGVAVTGIEASEAMLARLREKPGGRHITTVIGDFEEVPVEGLFPLVYVAFNTFFWLPSQDSQQRCLQNVASHLEPDGYFVLDAFVPEIDYYERGQRLTVTELLGSGAALDVSLHDPQRQTITANHVVLTTTGAHLYPVLIRYAWPSEIDALAAAAGLRLVERWADYDRNPFGPGSRQHVSVYTRAK